MAWVFPGVIVLFSLTLSFPDSFDEMGSLIQFMWDGQIGFEVEWDGSSN